MTETLPQDPDSHAGLSRFALYGMAAAAGIAVANVYYNQPILGLIESHFTEEAYVGFIPTVTQLGYAVGLFLLVPLGDIVKRRNLIIVQFLALAIASLFAALSPTAWMLVAASALLGASATVAQQIVPFAASLAAPERRGSTIGTVMAGLLSGILFSRTLPGFIGDFSDWEAVFWVGAPLALVAAGLMYAVLPHHGPTSDMSYAATLRSLAHLWKRERDLRIAAIVQALLFASFTAFWTILALLLATPEFDLGADVAGLFGIVGAVGILAAPLAGRIADRRGPHFVVWLGAIVTVVSWVILGTFVSLPGLVIGVIVLDFGIQSALVSNQHIIYALDPGARSRLNTVFMTIMFLGGSAGSGLASVAWTHFEWPGVSLLGGVLALAALAVRFISHKAARHDNGTVPAK